MESKATTLMIKKTKAKIDTLFISLKSPRKIYIFDQLVYQYTDFLIVKHEVILGDCTSFIDNKVKHEVQGMCKIKET